MSAAPWVLLAIAVFFFVSVIVLSGPHSPDPPRPREAQLPTRPVRWIPCRDFDPPGLWCLACVHGQTDLCTDPRSC